MRDHFVSGAEGMLSHAEWCRGVLSGAFNDRVSIQVGATLRADPREGFQKPAVVWYGTSILQGGVASRPGNAFTNMISRRLKHEIYNFGFSGNGKMEVGVYGNCGILFFLVLSRRSQCQASPHGCRVLRSTSGQCGLDADRCHARFTVCVCAVSVLCLCCDCDADRCHAIRCYTQFPSSGTSTSPSSTPA